MTHEGIHTAPEPGVPGDDVDYGLRGPLDNAYNYQGLVAELADLSISTRLLGEIYSHMSR